jgi:signal transduction histidine kinase
LQVPKDPTLPPALAEAVYFSCVDALEQLGETAKVAITVLRNEETVVFEINADHSATVTADADLFPIRDRVEALGGALTIQSEPRHTSITGSLPISG